MTTQTFSIRPGRRSDVPLAASLYISSFHADQLLDILFPTRHDYPEAFASHLHRIFVDRWWTPNFDLAVCVDRENKPVGFTWWKKPNSQLTLYERWLSPYAWTAPIFRVFLSLRNWLLPIPNLESNAAGIYMRVFTKIQPEIINSPARESAWYLSSIGVDPKFQGKGLGSMLLQDGLQKADQRGVATWLVGVSGSDNFYGRYGFAEVARANVGELDQWNGGVVMFRE